MYSSENKSYTLPTKLVLTIQRPLYRKNPQGIPLNYDSIETIRL